MGYRPSYLLLRALYRARENFASRGDGLGIRLGGGQRRSAVPEPNVTRRVREGQRLRVVMRRGGWA